MPEQRALDGETLLAYVREVAAELPDDGQQRRIVVVGGALLAWLGLRESTRDVDSVERLDEVLVAAVEVVAGRHDLAPRWVNDAAAGYVPQGFDPARGEKIWASARLQVLGAPLDQVFLMKLLAGRAADTDDIRALWSRSGFASTDEAAAAFHEAYPFEEYDPHLARWLDDQLP